uniref:Uncharacterized protein n=1 Tax=Anguilla anguilla TaxID=7936 RepID=A0A0E9TUN5_ANGAN
MFRKLTLYKVVFSSLYSPHMRDPSCLYILLWLSC